MAAAVNPSDVKATLGIMPHAVFPRTPGRDFAGIVVDGPDALKGLKVWGSGGDIGITRNGSHARYLVLPTGAVKEVPKGISMEEAGSVGVPFVTACEGFSRAGGVGIPGTANGIKVVFDTWDNGCGANPEIQIYNGTGYNECAVGIVKVTNTAGNLNFLRSNSYNQAVINYNNGIISVSVNGILWLSTTYSVSFVGYMGFTASTGGANDRHSIKNAIIYTEQAISDAGPVNGATCSDVPLSIGVTNNPLYSYSWSPALGLSSTSASNPTLTLTNSTNSPITYIYTVSTTLLTNFGACPTTDASPRAESNGARCSINCEQIRAWKMRTFWSNAVRIAARPK